MMMLPTSCESSSRRRNSRSFAYTELVILMVVLGFTLADNGIMVAGSVTDAVALGCIPKNNPLLLIAPSSVLPNSALKEGGIKHDQYKRKGMK